MFVVAVQAHILQIEKAIAHAGIIHILRSQFHLVVDDVAQVIVAHLTQAAVYADAVLDVCRSALLPVLAFIYDLCKVFHSFISASFIIAAPTLAIYAMFAPPY